MDKGRPKQIFVLDLPDELSIGRIAVQPANAFCWRLHQCESCGGYAARAYLACCGHAFCTRCAFVPSSTVANGDEHQVWCPRCGCRQEAEFQEVGRVLEKMKFACTCGVEGTLREIKQHFWDESQTESHCSVLPQQSTTKPSVKQANFVNAFKKRLDDFDAEIRQLTSGVDTLKITAGDHGCGVLWLPVQRLIDDCRRGTSAAFSPLYKWKANGLAIATQFAVKKIENTLWLGAAHRAAHDVEGKPFKAYNIVIAVSIVDLKGVALKRSITPTVMDEKPASEAFEKPLTDAATGGYGPYTLYKIEQLERPEGGILTSNGLINVKLEILHPLHFLLS